MLRLYAVMCSKLFKLHGSPRPLSELAYGQKSAFVDPFSAKSHTHTHLPCESDDLADKVLQVAEEWKQKRCAVAMKIIMRQ